MLPNRVYHSRACLILLSIALFVSTVSVSPAQAQGSGQHITIYWTDKGINQWQAYKDRPNDNFGTNFTSVFPVRSEGKILVLMSATEQLTRAEIERRLEVQIRSGLQKGVTEFEIRTVQTIGSVGYFDFVSAQPEVVEFTMTFLEALNDVKDKLAGYEATVHGFVGSNGGYAATESISLLSSRGRNPVNTLTIFDGRAYSSSTQRTIDALEGHVTLVCTNGDFWALPDMVANFSAARSLKDENPKIRVLIVDPNPEGLNIRWDRYHIRAMDPQTDLQVTEYLGNGSYSAKQRFAGSDLHSRIIPGKGRSFPSDVSVRAPDVAKVFGSCPDDKTRCPPLFPPPPTPSGGGAGAYFGSPLLTGNRTTLPPELAGVDFSSLQLNYFTEFSNGQADNLGYVFKAIRNEKGNAPISVEREARNSFDALFVWLALSPDTFWVNLNPNQPDRVIDSELGRTDAGRIMLEADFQMKKTVAKLIHPDSVTGKVFWDQLYSHIEKQGITRLCFSFRQWIVPGKVTVFSTTDSIYILDATLDVKLESDYLKLKGAEGTAMAACPPDIDPALQTYATDLFGKMILPELIKQVNTAPEYRDIRNIYHSRIIAEWYKTQHRVSGQAFANVIGRGKVTEWYSTTPWNPQELFKAYVQSITQGEFNITRQSQTTEGNYIMTRTRAYFYGGVDFTKIETTPIAYSALVAQKPNVDQQVFDALLNATGHWDASEVWLGGLYSFARSAGGTPTPTATLTVVPSASAGPTSAAPSPTTARASPTAPPSASTPSSNPSLPCGIGAATLILLAWGAWIATRR